MSKLNLGSGNRPEPGYINIDIRPEVNPDLVCDVSSGLPFPDGSVKKVRAFDFLEHIPLGQTVSVIEEIYRVMEPGGVFESLTPDAEYGQGAFQDPFHLSFWVEGSWRYYCNTQERELYGIKACFELETLKRVVTGDRVFHIYVLARKPA